MATLDITNSYQTRLFEKNVLIPYLKEYQTNTLFSPYMGGSSAVINKVAQPKGHGDVIVFPTKQTFMPLIKRGEDQLEGAESELTYSSDEVRIGTLRFATRITNKQLLELQSRLAFDSDLKDDLLRQSSLMNTKRVVSAFAQAFTPSITNNRDNINFDYAYSELAAKIATCGIDAANASGDVVSNTRLMFGNDFRTNEATIAAVMSAGNFTAANGHYMSVKHIVNLVTLARTGGRTSNTYKEAPVRPYLTKQPHHAGYVEPRYILFTAPEAYNYMRNNDADWRTQISRGVIENPYQPSMLYAGAYKGSVEGVDVVVVDELSNFVQSNTAYSILCGASAVGFAMGAMPNFKYSERDYGMHKGIAHEEISGIKVLKYPSKGDPKKKGTNTMLVENGIVHSFTKIA